ncbi:protein of unknown function [Taphrina deformans PYCC 5710]|uniref:Uncharacterized protein n=1 Tax=Taphrina deformans (strain PYCC 5710 / ATCC 11124 / CBS 356.35 / IMI 108563 / JCM 9778 / NBRC 8474) TaxID=1097556 RepID=R4XCP4_TAPDE|nr:protein of unknown function [Taphrina deformans PYCC 5710]|eukprot:CCG83393.1 protein of unknown function [Taphrina deformans PYCC 5710]
MAKKQGQKVQISYPAPVHSTDIKVSTAPPPPAPPEIVTGAREKDIAAGLPSYSPRPTSLMLNTPATSKSHFSWNSIGGGLGGGGGGDDDDDNGGRKGGFKGSRTELRYSTIDRPSSTSSSRTTALFSESSSPLPAFLPGRVSDGANVMVVVAGAVSFIVVVGIVMLILISYGVVAKPDMSMLDLKHD